MVGWGRSRGARSIRRRQRATLCSALADACNQQHSSDRANRPYGKCVKTPLLTSNTITIRHAHELGRYLYMYSLSYLMECEDVPLVLVARHII